MRLPIIPLHCYPCFHACHLANVPNTARIEALGAAVLAADAVARANLLPQFIRQVCQWGGGFGPFISVKVLNPANNLPARRFQSFNAAIDALAAEDILSAINQIVSLYGFGISFGSKQLRMLRPDICGVLDNLVLSELHGYANKPASYRAYCLDCSEQAERLNDARIFTICGQPWNAGAVDMAVFAWIRANRGSWNCRCKGDGHVLSAQCISKLSPKRNLQIVPSGVIQAGMKTTEKKLLPEEGKPRPKTSTKRRIFLDHARPSFVKVIDTCDATRNNAVISRTRRVVWLSLKLPNRSPSYLIGEIVAAGGDFINEPGYECSLEGAALGVGSGTGFAGGVSFPSIDHAVSYLEQYFVVDRCG